MNSKSGLFLLAVLLGGCSLVSIESKTRYSDAGGFFEPRLLDEIRANETTRDWLHQHFGEPLFVDRDFTNPMAATEEVQIETWQFVRHQQKNTRVFLLFSSRKRHEDSEYLHAVLADNKVIKAWRDKFETVDTRRIMGALGYAPASAKKEASENEPVATEGPAAPVETTAAVPPAAALQVLDVEEGGELDSQPAPTTSLGPLNLGYSPSSP